MYKRKNRVKDLFLPIIAFLGVIGIWEIIDHLLKIKEVILPNPHEIFFAIADNKSSLLKHTAITMLESILGFVIACILAVVLAIVFVRFTNVKKAFYPYAIALKATPLYALAPVLMVWFGNGIWAKVVMAAMVAFFPVLVSSVKGFTAVDQEQAELFKSVKATPWQTFFKLRFPSALPYMMPAIKMSTTFAVVGATIAEFTGSSAGIGHLIISASYYLDTSLMFAGIVMISIAGVLFFYLLEFIERKIVFWQKHD